MLTKKRLNWILYGLIAAICLPALPGYTFSDDSSSAKIPGPPSIEPMLEKDGVRVSLRTNVNSRNEMTVLVRISNFSQRPVLVTPDALEASTEDGFVIAQLDGNLPARTVWENSQNKKPVISDSFGKMKRATALIPFSSPYRIASTAHQLALFAEKTLAEKEKARIAISNRGLLQEVILPPGMATHGFVIYDASFVKAYDRTPAVNIKVQVGDEPFEFRFSGGRA